MICTRCHSDKSLDAFPLNRRFRTGHSRTCKACISALIPVSMVCQTCHSEKALQDFRKRKSTFSGYGQPCKTCFTQYQQAQCLLNPEKARARGRQRYAKNSEKMRAQALAYNIKHREQRRKQGRQRYANDPERFRQEARQRRAADPEKARARVRSAYHNNPTKVRLVFHRRQARKRGLPDTFTVAERTFMLQYWGYACAVCRRQPGLFGLIVVEDHWVPLVHPACPGTVKENIVPLCHGKGGCNNSKKSYPAQQWLTKQYGSRKAARIMKDILTYFESISQRVARAAD